MHNEFRSLRLKQLDRSLESFRAAQTAARPQKGWIRAIREAVGVSAAELGRILGTSRQLPLQFEKAEAEGSITLKSLRNVANALDCDLVYALVPRAGSMREDRPRAVARKRAPGAERTPALKGKAVKRIDAAVGVEAPAPSAATDENLGPYFCD
jgi:predicted DNA-binding mobile mystery protein A